MTIIEELSIIKDNLAEYGQTNITEEEYDLIKNEGIAELSFCIIKQLEFLVEENTRSMNLALKFQNIFSFETLNHTNSTLFSILEVVKKKLDGKEIVLNDYLAQK